MLLAGHVIVHHRSCLLQPPTTATPATWTHTYREAATVSIHSCITACGGRRYECTWSERCADSFICVNAAFLFSLTSANACFSLSDSHTQQTGRAQQAGQGRAGEGMSELN